MRESPTVIAVTGACGFIGRAVVHRLLDAGYNVRALVRSDALWPFCDHPHLVRCTGDMTEAESLRHLMRSADGVVHLAARKIDEDDSESVNVGGAKNLVRVCEEESTRWIINISSQSAKLHHAGVYGTSKRQADAVFQASKIPVTTLMLSLVYGPGRSGVFGTLVRLASLPLTPIIGRGDMQFRPIHVEDVAKIIQLCIEIPETRGFTYDNGGDDNVSLRTFLQTIKKILGVSSPIISLPTGFLLFIAKILSLLPHPPITVSNIRGAMENITMDITPFHKVTGFTPRTLDQGLKEALSPLPYNLREACALLEYCKAPSRIAWHITERDIDRYCRALKAHNIPAHQIDEKFLRSHRKLAALDFLCTIQKKPSVLRQKLITAAAIVETNPLSSSWLLPKDYSLFAIITNTWFVVARIIILLPYCLPLLIPSTFRRNAGL